jgi:hypothetical protein
VEYTPALPSKTGIIELRKLGTSGMKSNRPTIIDKINSGLDFKFWSIEKLPDNYLEIKEYRWMEREIVELWVELDDDEYSIFIEDYFENGLFSGKILFALDKSGYILYEKLVLIS